jgi:purine/pyrimidine-nucleoside phosphorylase
MPPMLKHNSYFDGNVQSIGFERHGFRMTAGVIDRGEYHFDTRAPERMTVVSGELFLRAAGQSEWRCYPAGTSFEVGGQTGFDVKANEPSAYVCEFLG